MRQTALVVIALLGGAAAAYANPRVEIRGRDVLLDGKGHIPHGIMHAGEEHFPEAEEWLLKAIEADQENDVLWNLAMDYAGYAELLKQKGNLENAKENLVLAIGIYRDCGAEGWLEKAEKELAQL